MKKTKDILRKIFISILRELGSVSGFFTSFLSNKNKIKITNQLCNFSFELSGKLYFLFYEFLNEMLEKIFFYSKEPILMNKKVDTGGAMLLDITEKTQRNIYMHKLYEINVSNFILKNLQEKDIFFDIGSNVGYFSVLTSPLVGVNGRIYAFEPEFKNFNFLVSNIKRNNFLNVVCVNSAVGNSDGKITLNLNPLNKGGHSVNKFDKYKTGKKQFSVNDIKNIFPKEELFQEVSIVSIDDFVRKEGIEKIDIIKIDIEGYELEALKGMKEFLKNQSIKYVICEVNNKKTRRMVFDFMKSFGYKTYSLDTEGSPHKYNFEKVLLAGNVLFSLSDF